MSTLIIQSFLESVLLDSTTFDSISKYVTDDQTISLPPYSRGHKYADFFSVPTPFLHNGLSNGSLTISTRTNQEVEQIK